MLEFYRETISTYHNNYFIGQSTFSVVLDAEPENTITELNWDNLSEFYQNHLMTGQFNIWTFKKGRVVSFFDIGLAQLLHDKDSRDVKEWKSPLNISIHYTYRKYTPSLEQILKWHNPEMATKYLNEHNLLVNFQKTIDK